MGSQGLMITNWETKNQNRQIKKIGNPQKRGLGRIWRHYQRALSTEPVPPTKPRQPAAPDPAGKPAWIYCGSDGFLFLFSLSLLIILLPPSSPLIFFSPLPFDYLLQSLMNPGLLWTNSLFVSGDHFCCSQPTFLMNQEVYAQMPSVSLQRVLYSLSLIIQYMYLLVLFLIYFRWEKFWVEWLSQGVVV